MQIKTVRLIVNADTGRFPAAMSNCFPFKSKLKVQHLQTGVANTQGQNAGHRVKFPDNCSHGRAVFVSV